MDDVIEKYLNSSGNNVTFDMKVKAIQDLDGIIFDSNDLKNINLFESIIEVTAKHLKSTQYKITNEILIFLSHMNQYISQCQNMVPYLRIYIPNLYSIALERLGDSKEKVRELTATYTLEIMQLASYFPREKFNMVIEKEFRTALATTKFFRVKEQLILLVVESYKTIQGFQIQYYIPNIVQSLEDSNEVVRQSSKDGIINIISNSQTRPEVIRQIKKEMTKNKVRQAIIDSIFSQVSIPEEDSKPSTPILKSKSLNSNMSSSVISSSSESLDIISNGTKTPPPKRIPQKTMSSPVPGTNNSSSSSSPVNTVVFKFPGKKTVSQDVNIVSINSEKEYENALNNMVPTFHEKESENNWEKRERFMKQIRGMIRGGAADFDKNCKIIKIMLPHILKTTHSLRTTLAITTIGTIIEMAENYQTQMDPIAEAVVTNLLDLTSQTKKLIATSSTQGIYIILRNISYNPKILNLFHNTLSDKNANTRSSTILFIGVLLEEMVKSDSLKAVFQRTGGLDIIEKSIKKGLQDANPTVRETSRTIYILYNDHYKDRASALLNTLDITTRKTLTKALNGNGVSSTSSSVAASPKVSRRTRLVSSPALGELKRPSSSLGGETRRASSSLIGETRRPNSSLGMRGKSQTLLSSQKSTSSIGIPKYSSSTSLRVQGSMSPKRVQATLNSSRKASSGLVSNSSSTPHNMSPSSSHSGSKSSLTSNNNNNKSNTNNNTVTKNKSLGLGRIETSSLLQSMNQALNNSGTSKLKSMRVGSSNSLSSSSSLNKTSKKEDEERNTKIVQQDQLKQQKLQQLQQKQQQQQQQQQLQQQKEMEKSSSPKKQNRPRLPSTGISSPISEKDEDENLSPICIELLTKLKDRDWKVRVDGLEKLLNYITSPEYKPCEKLTKTYLSLFRDPSPYILNVIFKPDLMQPFIEKKFVTLDKLIPKIYSVIEPPDQKTGEFDDISKSAYDAIVWLKSRIRKEVILDSLLMCLENKLNNQFMSETVFEGILSWLVEIVDRSPDRAEIQHYFSQKNNYNVALEELLEVLLRRDDNNSINNIYIIKLIQALQELDPTSYDDVMSEYADNIQFIILKRIHNNDYDLSEIEREFIEKELSNQPKNKFRESHLFSDTNILTFNDPKSDLLTEETIPEGFSDLTISRNTFSSKKTDVEETEVEDHNSENTSIINELVSKTWSSQSPSQSQKETFKDSTNATAITKTKSEISDQQTTPKLSHKKPEDIEEDIIHISSPIDAIPFDQITVKDESILLEPSGDSIEDSRLNSLNNQFKLLVDVIHESNEIDHEILDIKVFRRLIRYSREYPLRVENHSIQDSKDSISIKLWNTWFNLLYQNLYQYIDNENNIKNIENYENCILLFKHLIINQTRLFEGNEKEIMKALIKCRSLIIDEVCSASEDTIEALCEKFNNEKSIEACLELLADQEFNAQSPHFKDIEEYRPSYKGSLFMILSKLVQSVDVNYLKGHINSLLEAISESMNDSEIEIRKAALDSLVSLYYIYNENNTTRTEKGEEFLNIMDNYLTLPQKRILEIYIQRFEF
ncbi:clasp N terminal-domain-containing protein [Neocallimastix sp. 'constans']|jgi:hypothetical protein